MPSSEFPIDRRDMIARTVGAGAIAVAGAHVTPTQAAPSVHEGSDEIIKVGLVGCGGRGRGAAINSMRADPGVRITALADLFDDSIVQCRRMMSAKHPEQFQVDDDQCFTGFDAHEKLMRTDVDVVLLAAPPHYRPDHMESAVAAGKQIFCEKPVATDPVGVRRVEAACKIADEKGLNVVSGLCWRYDRGMQETVARIHDGEIGDVITSQVDYLTNPLWVKAKEPGESDMRHQCRNWYNYIWLSGDHLVEQAIHSVDKALWVHHNETPVKAYGLGGRQQRSDAPMTGNIYDHFSLVYEWADGTRTYANARQMRGCLNQKVDLVFGTEGSAQLIKHRIDGKRPWRFEGDEVQMHQAEQDEMYRAIRGQRERINNADYMCRSTMMVILGREACYTGQELTYDQVANSDQDFRPASYDSDAAPDVIVPQPGTYEFS